MSVGISKSKRTAILAIALAIVASSSCILAQNQQAQSQPAQNMRQVAPVQQVQQPVASGRLIVVSIPDRKLVLMEGGVATRVYPVAVGKPSTPSPAGHFTIVRQVSNPTYSHRGKVVAPGPRNPVGSRCMGLSERGYGIHGTNEPGSIGKAASHGCIRMGKADLEELYAVVQVGDAVEIHTQHDATVAMALGEASPATPAAPATAAPVNQVLLANNAIPIQHSAGR